MQNLITSNYFIVEEGTTYQLPLWKMEENNITPLLNDNGEVRAHTIQFATNTKQEQEIEILENSGEMSEDEKVLWVDTDGNRYFEGSPNLYMMPAVKTNDSEGKEVYVPMPLEGEQLNFEIVVEPKNIISKQTKESVHTFIPYTLKVVTVPSVPGVVFEALLGTMIETLKQRSSYSPSRETSIAITKMEEASLWLAKDSAEKHKNLI
jgi:hypothetical protein